MSADLETLWQRYEALDSNDEALAVIDEIIERLRRVHSPAQLAEALKERGLVLSSMDRPREAKAAFLEAEPHEVLLDPTSRFYLLCSLAHAHDDLGELDAAISMFVRAVAASTIFGATSEQTVIAQLALGAALTDAERFDEAADVYRTMLAIPDPDVVDRARVRLESVLELQRLTR